MTDKTSIMQLTGTNTLMKLISSSLCNVILIKCKDSFFKLLTALTILVSGPLQGCKVSNKVDLNLEDKSCHWFNYMKITWVSWTRHYITSLKNAEQKNNRDPKIWIHVSGLTYCKPWIITHGEMKLMEWWYQERGIGKKHTQYILWIVKLNKHFLFSWRQK